MPGSGVAGSPGVGGGSVGTTSTVVGSAVMAGVTTTTSVGGATAVTVRVGVIVAVGEGGRVFVAARVGVMVRVLSGVTVGGAINGVVVATALLVGNGVIVAVRVEVGIGLPKTVAVRVEVRVGRGVREGARVGTRVAILRVGTRVGVLRPGVAGVTSGVSPSMIMPPPVGTGTRDPMGVTVGRRAPSCSGSRSHAPSTGPSKTSSEKRAGKNNTPRPWGRFVVRMLARDMSLNIT